VADHNHRVPRYRDIDWTGLEFSEEQFIQIMTVDRELWYKEIAQHNELFLKLYDRLPKVSYANQQPLALV
jgi:phosphoenolpyruvate carboxykinase (GTP)